LVYGLVDLLKSYWDSEDHEYLTELLQNYGIPIRFVGIFPDYRVYYASWIQAARIQEGRCLEQVQYT
jgi:hypothetical protein